MSLYFFSSLGDQWAAWGSWTQCSQSCYDAALNTVPFRYRLRTCPNANGCAGSPSQIEICNFNIACGMCLFINPSVHHVLIKQVINSLVPTCLSTWCNKGLNPGFHLIHELETEYSFAMLLQISNKTKRSFTWRAN